MLIVERTSDGRRIVRLHADWHPGRIGLAWYPRQKNFPSRDMDRLQAALLLRKGK